MRPRCRHLCIHNAQANLKILSACLSSEHSDSREIIGTFVSLLHCASLCVQDEFMILPPQHLSSASVFLSRDVKHETPHLAHPYAVF